MTTTDFAELIGYLFAAWASGYVLGLIVLAFRRFFESF